jgi:hypothetical protein
MTTHQGISQGVWHGSQNYLAGRTAGSDTKASGFPEDPQKA